MIVNLDSGCERLKSELSSLVEKSFFGCCNSVFFTSNGDLVRPIRWEVNDSIFSLEFFNSFALIKKIKPLGYP